MSITHFDHLYGRHYETVLKALSSSDEIVTTKFLSVANELAIAPAGDNGTQAPPPSSGEDGPRAPLGQDTEFLPPTITQLSQFHGDFMKARATYRAYEARTEDWWPEFERVFYRRLVEFGLQTSRKSSVLARVGPC